MRKLSKEEVEKKVNDLGYELLKDYFNYKKRRVIIRDFSGYKYDIVFQSLIRYPNVHFVDRGNPFSLENISLWLKLNNKDIELDKNNVYVSAKTKLNFYHKKCGEHFDIEWDHIFQKQGCPFCAGKRIGNRKSLAYLRPDIAKEWNPNNILKPEEVTLSSGRKVFWICSICGYGSNNEWCSSISGRTKYNRGCPSCVGQVVSDKNRLSTLFSEIAKEWHSTKNGNLLPENVSYGSNRKIWWLCSNSHEYCSSISNRTRLGRGCPKCSESKGEKAISKWKENNENRLENIGIISFESQKRFFDCRDNNPLPFDFGIKFKTNKWLLIEYRGIQHYENIEFFNSGNGYKGIIKRDKIKEKYCKDNEISLLIIPYWEFDNIESILNEKIIKRGGNFA